MNNNEFLIAQGQVNQTLFTNQTPSLPSWTDGVTYELGMKFRSNVAGQISAIRYLKPSNETGTHVGKIWSADGTLLASVNFVNESNSGWQQQLLDTPLNIGANTTYIVSVNCNSHYPVTPGGLANSIVNGNLSSVADNNNGVYGLINSFPTNSYSNSNYFRDVVFEYVPVPTITKVSGDNQTGTAATTLSQPLVVRVEDGAGNPQEGVNIDFATMGGGSLSPVNATTNSNGEASTVLTLGALPPGSIYPAINTVTATVSNVGNVTFTATANPTGVNYQRLFTNQTPFLPSWTDGVTYELGMKFRTTVGGKIIAIRYLKPSDETGTHVGKIWSADGTLLASVNFVNESNSGWQQQFLDTPLNIAANTTYTVSVNCNSHYPVTQAGLANSIVNGNLNSVADNNNGVYSVISQSFPTNSYNNSNYFRDLVFVAGSAVSKISGDNQNGLVGTVLPEALVVRTTNSVGNALAGVTINFEVTSGGGSVSPTSAITNANGEASTFLTLGSIPSGPNNTVIVTATAVGIGSTSFSAKALPEDTNPITTENQKVGNSLGSFWYTQPSSQIAGYAGATSVNKGGTLPIKVSLAQSGQFTIEVYRLGFYGGAGARRVFSSGQISGNTQAPATLNPSTRLVECNWSTSYTLNIGSDWTTGLYVVKLIETTSGQNSLIPFVVRDDSSQADILFQSSFNRFAAYNNALGYSLYEYNSIGGQRAFKVSYDKPFTEYYFLLWEYNMVMWLESQGYNVAYVTNVDIHTSPHLLQQHKIFLSVGHDEYWTSEQRSAVEQARDGSKPVNLAFFSANTCYWRIRFENSTNTQQPNRVITCYKQPGDPVIPTVRFREAPINQPENALLGVMYTGFRGNPWLGGYDFVVANSADPYYANTGLSNGDTLSLLVGFEWDAVINNSFTPNNLVILSQSPVIPEYVDDALPPGTNTQIANAVRYTAASGAQVFSTGSIQWMWGLNSYSINPPRVDFRAQQMTVNILASMGALPTTPDADIIIS